MDQILIYLQNIPSSEFYQTLGILIYTTCSGFVPNNNDLSIAAAALITNMKSLPATPTALFCFAIWSLGESTTFTIGYFLGPKLLKSKLLQKKMSEKRQADLKKMIDENLFSLIFTVRISPVLRAYTILALGALGLTPLNFFCRHIPLLFIHVMVVFHAFFYLGPILKSFFADNSTYVFIAIFIVWVSMMFYVGRKFYKKLESST
ncbi:MAG: VTT domain-containing protein [Bacteriovoracaceae bacterium]